MHKDKLYLVGTACGVIFLIFGVVFLSLLFPGYRSFFLGVMILAIGVILFLAIVVVVLFVFFSRGVQGPKSLSGTRCRKCGHRRVMQEVNREFLQGNVKTDFDHYKVIYRCTQCGHQQEQEEHVIPQPK